MSQSIPTGYIPPGNPQGLAQKTCPGGRDLTFESCLGAENLTRTGILWKMKVKRQKNSVDQTFTGENKKKQAEILTFLGLCVFSMEFFVGFFTYKPQPFHISLHFVSNSNSVLNFGQISYESVFCRPNGSQLKLILKIA